MVHQVTHCKMEIVVGGFQSVVVVTLVVWLAVLQIKSFDRPVVGNGC